MNQRLRTAWLVALCLAPSVGAFVQGMQLMGASPVSAVSVPLSGPNDTAWAALTPTWNQRKIEIYVQAPPDVCRAWAFNGLNLSATQNGHPVTVNWQYPTHEYEAYDPDECDQTGQRQLAFLNVEPGVPVRVSARQREAGAYTGDSAFLRIQSGSYSAPVLSLVLLLWVSPVLALVGLLLFMRWNKRQTI